MRGYQGQLREGMTVYSIDGEKLGKIVRADADSFVIEKGLFFPKDYLCRYESVTSVDGDDVRLSVAKEELHRLGDLVERDDGLGDNRRFDATGAGAIDAPGGPGRMARDDGDVRVTAVEEQLEAHKRVRSGGEVEIRKEVVTEQKQITVPVMREEVHVERHAVNRPAGTGEAGFKGDTIRVPVVEEEVEIRKRPVVREEVRVSKTPHVEQRTATESVRREEIDVDREHEKRITRKDDPNKKLV